ncbi:MAG TPA: pYEATS domain-containing protein [Pyrinomonadaceae bacterium]|jgi:transcription initiation factor IIF auxiliary subunit
MKLSLKQEATYEGNEWWKWSVWVEGDTADLKRIKYVEYTLHPTFPEPVQRVENPSSKFRLDSSGWGEFTIRAQVVTKDGEKKNLRHHLELMYPSSEETQGESAPSKEAAAEERQLTFFLSCNVSDALFAGALSRAFMAEGARVMMLADEMTSLSWEEALSKVLEQTDYALFIVSDALSIWMKREIEAASAHKIPIIPILIMSGRVKREEFPPETQKAIQVKPIPSDLYEDEARGLVKRINKQIKSIPPASGKKKRALKR